MLCFSCMNFGWRRSAATKVAATTDQQTSTKPVERSQIKHAHAEINAYIVIRDRLLQEAEAIPSNSTLHRACIANDVVEIFLKPAKKPYKTRNTYLKKRRATSAGVAKP